MSLARNTDRLRTLDWIYRFAGVRGTPDRVDVENAISVVHDVSAHAAMLASRKLLLSAQIVTAGGGVVAYLVYSKADVLGNALDWEIPIGETDVWLHGVTALGLSSNVSNFSNAGTSIRPAATDVAVGSAGQADPNNTQLSQTAGFWENTTGWIQSSGSAYEVLNNTGDDGVVCGLPRRISSLVHRAQDDGTGASTVVFQMLFELTPRGIQPGTLQRFAS